MLEQNMPLWLHSFSQGVKKHETNFIFISLTLNKVTLGKIYNKMTSSAYLNFGLVCCDVSSSRYLQVILGRATSRKKNMIEIYRLMVTKL